MMQRWIRVTSFLALLLVVPWPAQAIQWGAGTGTSYPTTLDTANNRTNVGGGSCSSAITTNICKEWLNDWQGAVIAIMTELGTLPKGSFADVKTRLNAAVVSGTAGLSSYVAGDLLQASNTTTLARLANVATGNVLLSGGVGVVSAWGKVGLTTHVDGILPTANGGTGIAYFTAAGPSTARVYTFPDAAATILYSGGALGTPSSGTLTNVTGLPAASVLAGTLGTGAYVMDTTLTLPTLIGGTGTTSTLVLQSTSGVGASDAIIFKVGNNGGTTALTIDNAGIPTIDGSTPSLYFGSSSSLFVRDGTSFRMAGNLGIPFEIRVVDAQPIYLKTSNTIRLTVDGSGNTVLGGPTSAASLLDLRAGDLTFSGANGQAYTQGRKTELTTIAAAATTATTITIPANAILRAVMMRVTVQPPGTATMVVTATTSGTVLQQGASMSTAINTTDVGTRAYGTNYVGVAAQTITITPNATPSDATGRVRFEVVYDEPTAPTS